MTSGKKVHVCRLTSRNWGGMHDRYIFDKSFCGGKSSRFCINHIACIHEKRNLIGISDDMNAFVEAEFLAQNAFDLIIISTNGVIIRIRVSDVRIMSRYATGVKVMRTEGEERIVSFTRAEHDDNAEIEKVEGPSEEEMAAAEAEEKNEVIAEDEDISDEDIGEEDDEEE